MNYIKLEGLSIASYFEMKYITTSSILLIVFFDIIKVYSTTTNRTFISYNDQTHSDSIGRRCIEKYNEKKKEKNNTKFTLINVTKAEVSWTPRPIIFSLLLTAGKNCNLLIDEDSNEDRKKCPPKSFTCTQTYSSTDGSEIYNVKKLKNNKKNIENLQ
ncbi:Hypothetical protein SRAE_X000146200 [Strongyloides ratti]|uniref:Uncharacterized protein n=1 Tax=Strongyloides ratti TaxID=34506 RepID=A0A090MNT8_STRRB|nr:Hypothetical protein SRAE_X000146200 [Strongyloides ratti]CEF59716.1 Hypothetical protein SRAE_X000146200 [Strongyloides ratti]